MTRLLTVLAMLALATVVLGIAFSAMKRHRMNIDDPDL
jgi:hypothetical protein